jgi:hypothetical protein
MNTHATVSFMLLAHCCLTHRRCVYRELCLGEKVINFLAHVVSNSASIDQYNNVLFGFIYKLHNLIENVVLNIRIISRGGSRERNL